MKTFKQLQYYLKESKNSISPKALKWIEKWMWDKKISGFVEKDLPPKEIIEEFKNFRPNKIVKLYRGVPFNEWEFQKNKILMSFTYEKGHAEAIAHSGEFEEPGKKPGTIIGRNIKPEWVLVDFTKIPNWKKLGLINEVIVYKKFIRL